MKRHWLKNLDLSDEQAVHNTLIDLDLQASTLIMEAKSQSILKEYEKNINSGDPVLIAEVVRDLNKGDDLMVDQSYSERQLFEKAYERLLAEFQIVIGTSMEETQKKLDKALKRNLESQTPKVAAEPKENIVENPEISE